MPGWVQVAIVIPGRLSPGQYETLVGRLSETIHITQADIAAAGWDLTKNIERFVGTISTTSAAIGKFAQEIRDWATKQPSPPPEVILERPGRPPLVVTTASDEEIAQWLRE